MHRILVSVLLQTRAYLVGIARRCTPQYFNHLAKLSFDTFAGPTNADCYGLPRNRRWQQYRYTSAFRHDEVTLIVISLLANSPSLYQRFAYTYLKPGVTLSRIDEPASLLNFL